MLHSAMVALALLLEPMRLLILCAGVLIGLTLGAIPGLGGVVGLAVMIPFTYSLDTPTAFALLLGMAAVTTSSDLIPAILFGVPGSVGAAATTIDGHQMAKQGQAGRAFGAGFAASLFGGLVGAFILALSIPVLQPVMLAIGSPELLAFSIFGLSMVATLSGRAPLKGLTAAGLGLMISMVGAGAQTGTMRWTFDWLYVWDGVPLIPLTLGLFALPELADMAISRRQIAVAGETRVDLSNQWDGVRDVLRNWWLVLRCSAMGTMLGVVPGIGSAVIDWIVYGYAKRSCRNAEGFGSGDVRGVIAPESANNAKEGGHLVPTIAFGVPAGASMTLLLGAFLMHGLTPGPDMLTKNLDVTYGIIWTLTLAHVLGAIVCLFGSKWLARLAEIRHGVMLPLIAPVVFIAAFQGTRSWGDLYMLVGFGVLGWVMKRLNWPRPPMVLGLVVGKIFERYLFISMQIYGDAWLLRPVVMVVGLLIVWALYAPMKQTVVRLYREVRGLHWDHLRFGLNAAFSTFIIAVIGGALMTSADWPAIERIVPRAACWSALVAAGLNLLTEVFGADQATAHAHDAAPALELALPGGVVLQRAAVYFGWLAGLLVLIALVGFVPAIGIFILIYMRLGFGESWRNAAICASVTTLLCWGVFDRGLSVPWPQAALGDAVPWLRESTDLM
jgi:TctA family transporter